MARNARAIPYRTVRPADPRPLAVPERVRELSEDALVWAILCGSDPAFTELHRRYKGRLFVFVMHIVNDAEKAEDVVQETFLRIYRHLGRFNKTNKLSTWIYTIAQRLAWNSIRDRRRKRLVFFNEFVDAHEVEQVELNLASDHLETENLYEKRHLRELIEQSMSKLPTLFRLTFRMRELEGRTYDEMASIMGCPVGTVKSRVSRARIAFAAIIGPQLD